MTESNKFNTNGAKPTAFMPPPNLLTSVGRHAPSPVDTLVELASAFLGAVKVYGAALMTVKEIRQNELDVIADEPPARHANITGWNSNPDPDLRKAAQKEQALRLVSISDWIPF